MAFMRAGLAGWHFLKWYASFDGAMAGGATRISGMQHPWETCSRQTLRSFPPLCLPCCCPLTGSSHFPCFLDVGNTSARRCICGNFFPLPAGSRTLPFRSRHYPPPLILPSPWHPPVLPAQYPAPPSPAIRSRYPTGPERNYARRTAVASMAIIADLAGANILTRVYPPPSRTDTFKFGIRCFLSPLAPGPRSNDHKIRDRYRAISTSAENAFARLNQDQVRPETSQTCLQGKHDLPLVENIYNVTRIPLIRSEFHFPCPTDLHLVSPVRFAFPPHKPPHLAAIASRERYTAARPADSAAFAHNHHVFPPSPTIPSPDRHTVSYASHQSPLFASVTGYRMLVVPWPLRHHSLGIFVFATGDSPAASRRYASFPIIQGPSSFSFASARCCADIIWLLVSPTSPCLPAIAAFFPSHKQVP